MSTLGRHRFLASLAFVTALLALSLVAALMLAACGGPDSAGSSPAASSASPTIAASPSVPARVVHALRVDRDVRYTSRPEGGKGSSLLDVYAPVEAGPWPAVVLLHGGGATKNDYEPWAKKMARRGAVVYVPTWSVMDNEKGAKLSAGGLRAALTAAIGNIGAAVRFARGTAADYGGDAGNVTLFGHSYGAMGATVEALGAAPASATTNGLRGAGSTVPESLVAFDADYVLVSFGDDLMARDPGLMHVFSPWDYLGKKVDFPITIVDSRTPEMHRASRHPWAKRSWWQTRDPSGDLRRALEERGAFEDGRYNNPEGLKLFAERLRHDGDTVTYIALTDSSHWELGKKGMARMLDAIVPSSQTAAASRGETTSNAAAPAASPDAVAASLNPTASTSLPSASSRPALTYAGSLEPPAKAITAGTVGWRFRPTVDIQVTELGCYDANQDGLALSHRVGIFAPHTGRLLASVTVRPKSRLDGFFRWESLRAPLVLRAGRSYLVGTADRRQVEANDTNTCETLYAHGSEQWAPEISFGGLRTSYHFSGPAFAAPTDPRQANAFILITWMSPNFKFRPLAASAARPGPAAPTASPAPSRQ